MLRVFLRFIVFFFSLSVYAFYSYADTFLCRELFLNKKTMGLNYESSGDRFQQQRIILSLQKIEELLQNFSNGLAGAKNPFIYELNFERQKKIRDLLLIRYDDNSQPVMFKDRFNQRTTASPTAQIRDINQKLFLLKSILDWKTVYLVLSDAENYLKSPQKNKNLRQIDLLSIQWGLKITKEYLRKYQVDESELMEDRKISHSEKSNVHKKVATKERGNQKKEDPPEIFDHLKEYKPRTAAMNNGTNNDNHSNKKIIDAEANIDAKFWRLQYMNGIVRGRDNPFYQRELSGTNTAISDYIDTKIKMTISVAERNKRTLVLPSNMEPLQSSDSRVQILKSKDGTYTVSTSSPLKLVQISLRQNKKENLSIEDIETLTERVGIQEHEWPEKLRVSILNKLDPKSSPLIIAKEIEKHIQNEYNYTFDERDETDPIEALKAGYFQCSMGSYVMIGLLRDVYHIPSRIVFGFRAFESTEKGPDYSFLIRPAQGHVWVEIWDNGEWFEFDPTPINADQKRNVNKDDKFIQKNSIEGSSEKNSAIQKSNQSNQDYKKNVEVATKEGIEEINKHNNDEQDKFENQEMNHKEEPYKYLEKNKRTDIDLLNRKNSVNKQNPFIDYVLKTVLQYAIWPKENSITLSERLHRSSSLFMFTNNSYINDIYRRALNLFSTKQDSIGNSILSLTTLIRKQPITKSFHQANDILQKLLIFRELNNSMSTISNEIPNPDSLIRDLNEIILRINSCKHQDAGKVAVVEKFLAPLDRISRGLIHEKYLKMNDGQYVSVGFNENTYNIAEALASGKLDDFRLLGILSKLIDFIIESDPQLDQMKIKLLEQDLNRRTGFDILPTSQIEDIYRAINLQNQKSAFLNFIEGTSYVQSSKKVIQVPGETGEGEPQILNMIGYDTSESMIGLPSIFQSALVAAFVGKGMSKISAITKKPLARNKLIGFGEKVHSVRDILDENQAKNLIQNYREMLVNSNEGTDIQNFLETVFLEIIKTQNETGRKKPLERVNIVLISDGGSKINIPALSRLRNQINRRTLIQIMFLGVNNSNSELIELVHESSKFGINRGFYRQYDRSTIRDIIADSQSEINIGSDNGEFHSDQSQEQLPEDIEFWLTQAVDHSKDFISDLNSFMQKINSTSFWATKLNSQNIHHDRPNQREIEKWLFELRGIIDNRNSSVFLDQRFADMFIDGLMLKWETITGAKFKDLHSNEVESLKHLIHDVQNINNRSGG